MLPPGAKSLSDIAKIPDPEIRIGLYGTLLEWALKSLPGSGAVPQNLDSLIDHNRDKFADFRSVDGARWVRNQLVHVTGEASPSRIRTADADFDPIIRRLAEQYCSREVRDAALGLPKPLPPPVAPTPKPAPDVSPPVIYTPPPPPPKSNGGMWWLFFGGTVAALTISFLATQQPRPSVTAEGPTQFPPPASVPQQKAQIQAPPPVPSQPENALPPVESSVAVGPATDTSSPERTSEEAHHIPEADIKKDETKSIQRQQPTTVELLLERAQTSVGGRQALAGVRDSTTTSDVLYPDGRHARLLVQFVAPIYRRQEMGLLSGGKSISYTDGSAGWISTPSGVTPMPTKIVQDLGFYDLGRLLLSEHDSALTVVPDGTDALRITSQIGQAATLQFDPLSGLPIRLYYKFGANALELLPAMATFADWRPAGGLKWPFRMTIEVDGKLLRQDTVADIRLNTGLTVAEISARP
jgi:hypothetical protein